MAGNPPVFNAWMSQTPEEPDNNQPESTIGDGAIDDAVWGTITSDFTSDDW